MAPAPFDLVKQTKWLKAESFEFFMDIGHWRTFVTHYDLAWQKERFGTESHKKIPKERGIYAFTVELTPAKFPVHGYIMYMGITGDESKATLYSRYAQYWRQYLKKKGRPAVSMMLENWSGDLFFNFVALPDTAIDLEEIETAFISAVIPPINKRDFDATIAPAKLAKW